MAISQVAASASTTLDQGTDTVINTMTIPSLPAGTYLAFFSATLVSNTVPVDADTIFYSFYGNGSQVSGTERYYVEDNSFTDTDHLVANVAVITIGASQTIDVRYRISPTGRAWTMTNRVLTLLPVAIGDVTVITDTVDDTIAAAGFTVIDNMTNTPASGTYLALFTTTIEDNADDDLTAVAIHVGGTIVQHSERTALREQSYNQFGVPLLTAAKVAPNGSQAVDVRWERRSGTGTLTCKTRQLILVKMDSADLLETSGTADDTDATTSLQVIDNLTLTTPAANDWIALWGGTDTVPLGGPVITYGVHVGGTLVTPSTRVNEHEGSLDATDVWLAAHNLVQPNGSQDVDVRWQSTDTQTRAIHERSLLLIREAVGGAPEEFAVLWRED